MNQEALEEAFSKELKSKGLEFSSNLNPLDMFNLGAKWQAERMYTKDDVLMAMGYAVGISYDGRLSHIEIKKSCIEMLDKIKG
jgi:hypothetical protein